MIRIRVWFLIALVTLALGLNFGRLSPRIAQTSEETIRARLAASTNALHAQLELRDAQLAPRLAANSPDLIEALRPPADPTLPVPKPDEKALRAAAAAIQPLEPDLLVVATGDGAVYSRRGKPATVVDDIKDLPLVKPALDGQPVAPAFAQFDGALFRVQAARIPGSVGVVVVGLLIDDRFAAQLRAATEVDVTFFREGAIAASSLPEDQRPALLGWAKAPGLGYGTIALHLPVVGNALDGKLPRGASRYAVRAARAPFESGVMAALTLSSTPYFGWLARYQAFYLLGVALFLFVGLLLAIWPERRQPKAISPTPAISDRVSEAASRAAATLAGANDAAAKPQLPQDVPWTEGDSVWRSKGSASVPPAGPRVEPLAEPVEPEPAASAERAPALAAAPAPKATPSQPPPVAAEPLPPTPGLAADLDPFAFDAPAAIPALPTAPAEALPELEPIAAAEEPAAAAEEPAAAAEEPAATAEESAATAAAAEIDPFTAQPEPAAQAAPAVAEELHSQEVSASTGEFSFAGMLDEIGVGKVLTPISSESQPPDAAGQREQEPAPFGDEPTRVEAVSAALLDKLRERDESEPPAESRQEFGDAPAEPAAEAAPQAAAEPAPAEAQAPADPDEAHFQETYRRFIELRAENGEPADRVSYEKFTAKLRKNRDELLAKHGARGVRFTVYVKDGRAAIKASALR